MSISSTLEVGKPKPEISRRIGQAFVRAKLTVRTIGLRGAELLQKLAQNDVLVSRGAGDIFCHPDFACSENQLQNIVVVSSEDLLWGSSIDMVSMAVGSIGFSILNAR